MKKLTLSLLMILACVFCFAGCDNSLKGEYWKESGSAIETYLSSENAVKVKDITYSDSLTKIINSDLEGSYKELLDVYDYLYESSVFTAEKYVVMFSTNPVNKNKKLSNAFKSVNKNLKKFESQVTEFLKNKQNYEAHIESENINAYTEIKLSFLQDFKLEYLKVINSAYVLSESIFNAYLIGYLNFDNIDKIDAENISFDGINLYRKMAVNGANLELINSSIQILDLFNCISITGDVNNYINVSKSYFNEIVKQMYLNEVNESNKQKIIDQLSVWKLVYDDFLSDAEKFNKIVNELDFKLLLRADFNAEEYAEITDNENNKLKIDFFNNFYKNVNILYDYSTFN